MSSSVVVTFEGFFTKTAEISAWHFPPAPSMIVNIKYFWGWYRVLLLIITCTFTTRTASHAYACSASGAVWSKAVDQQCELVSADPRTGPSEYIISVACPQVPWHFSSGVHNIWWNLKPGIADVSPHGVPIASILTILIMCISPVWICTHTSAGLTFRMRPSAPVEGVRCRTSSGFMQAVHWVCVCVCVLWRHHSVWTTV